MKTEERRISIEALIKKEGEVDVNYLRDHYGVTNVTVRNDLIYLERKGIIKRRFGRAVLRDDRVAGGYSVFEVKNLPEKEKIGKLAASMINDGESVFLYTGSTSLQVAKVIDENKNFIAVTNCIYIAHEMRRYKNVKIVMIGGNLSLETGSTFGAQAIQQFEKYNIDKLFLSVDGIDAENGITNNNPFETDLNFAMLKSAKRVIVVADYTKVGKTHFIHMGNTENINVLITDSKAPEKEVQALRDKGVEVFLA